MSDYQAPTLDELDDLLDKYQDEAGYLIKASTLRFFIAMEVAKATKVNTLDAAKEALGIKPLTIVMNEDTLGVVVGSNLQVLRTKNSCFLEYNRMGASLPIGNSPVRAATKEDFRAYRVDYHGYLNDGGE
jgi:hypothetical protein